MLDFSVGVSNLDSSSINGTDYGDAVDPFFKINSFALDAEVSADDIDLEFPLVQSSTLNLEDGSFFVDFSMYLDSPMNLSDLFGQDSTSDFIYSGNVNIFFQFMLKWEMNLLV